MPISENMVQEIVQEVMAKMQIADAPTGKHGVFMDILFTMSSDFFAASIASFISL